MPTPVLPSRRLSSTRCPPPLVPTMPIRKPRTVQWRTVTLVRSAALMPYADVPAPAARPPSLNPLQSMVTLFVATVIAEPLVLAVVRSDARHHVPCVVMTAGSTEIVPVQLSYDSPAEAGSG